MRTKPIASTSQTAEDCEASGGGSPVSAITLRTPSACAPSRSDCSAIRLRSRVVWWISASMPASRWTRTARASALIRTRAIGESPMLIASAPASRSRRAPSIALRGLTPRGGSISTETTNAPSASLSRSREPGDGSGGSSAAGGPASTAPPRVSLTASGRAPPPAAAAGAGPAAPDAESSAARMARTCSGPAPQQPPITAAPRSCARSAKSAK